MDPWCRPFAVSSLMLWASLCYPNKRDLVCSPSPYRHRGAQHLSPKHLLACWGRAAGRLASFQPGFSRPKRSGCSRDTACPEPLILLSFAVPKSFSLCSAKFLAKLLLILTEQGKKAVWMPLDGSGVSFSRNLGAGPNSGPMLVLYNFCIDFQGAT